MEKPVDVGKSSIIYRGFIGCYYILPVVPHKAVAEVSRIGNYRRDWLL